MSFLYNVRIKQTVNVIGHNCSILTKTITGFFPIINNSGPYITGECACPISYIELFMNSSL